MGFVNKSKLVKSVDALLVASNLPTLTDLATKAASVAQEKANQAKGIVDRATALSAAGQEDYEKAVKAAAAVKAEVDRQVTAELNTASALYSEADDLNSAAKYISG